MSYGMAGALQAAIYERLSNDEIIEALVGDAVFDAMPVGELPGTFVSLGLETARDASDVAQSGALHTFDILVVTTKPGFAMAKAIAGAVSDALREADLVLSRGRVVYLRFVNARAQRGDGAASRQIRMRFRARLEDDEPSS